MKQLQHTCLVHKELKKLFRRKLCEKNSGYGFGYAKKVGMQQKSGVGKVGMIVEILGMESGYDLVWKSKKSGYDSEILGQVKWV